MKPSKWPFRILSPIGEGALGGRPPLAPRVADRRGLRGVGREAVWEASGDGRSTALFGGVGARGALVDVEIWGYNNHNAGDVTNRRRG